MEVGLLKEEATWRQAPPRFLKNGFRGFRGFRNTSVKFPKTLSKHIPLNIGEREEKKDENQIQKHFCKASVTFP